MRLSDYDGKYFQVVQDGVFEALGMLHLDIPRRTLGYVLAENYLRAACSNPDISCVICTKELAQDRRLLESGKGIAACESPDLAFLLLHNDLVQNTPAYSGICQDTQMGEGCSIHPAAFVAGQNVVMGDHVTVEPFAVIREGCRIGSNVVIRSGAVIGADNYGLCRDPDGNMHKIKEAGQVFLADDVEIGCLSVIAKGEFPYQATSIDKNTCIDGQVMISHNCRIGKNCFVAAHAHICGSTVIEDGVRINPAAVVKNAVTVGRNATVSLGAVVVRNVPQGMTVTGNFAVEHSIFLKDHLQKLRKNKRKN